MYRQALKEWPEHLDSLHMLGLVLGQSGRTDEAVERLERVLQHSPTDFGALTNLASILALAGRHEAALAPLQTLGRLQPENADVRVSQSEALRHAGRLNEALAAAGQALALSPHHLRGQMAHANALKRLGRFEEALQAFDDVLARHPQAADAHNDRGNVLFDLRRFDEAVAAFDKALAIRPAYPDALFNRSNTLRALHRFDEAIAGYEMLGGQAALAAESLNNLGVCLEMAGRHEEALTRYAAARAANPAHVMAHLNAALCHLLLGRFDEGWQLYRWRRALPEAAMLGREPESPELDGCAPLTDHHILVLCEQGLGDSLQFCRLIPLLRARGARVSLEIQPALRGLLSHIEGLEQIITTGEQRPETDFHVWLLDLPGLLGLHLPDLPPPLSGLCASAERGTALLKDLPAGKSHRPRIGLVWSGNSRHSNDHKRSMPLEFLASLLSHEADFVSLQPEVRPQDAAFLAASRVLDLQTTLVDFNVTADLIAALDLVISVDTSVAHLAGTLACPVWLMLPAKPDWRWLLGRSDSPWYPSMRLFRQPRHDDWAAVVQAIDQALAGFLCDWHSRQPH